MELSDDSDFYGDEATQRRFKRRCRDVDIHGYWATHSKLINVIAFEGRAQEMSSNEAIIAPDAKRVATQDLYNCWAHLENAKQLGETPSEFLQRLPPLTSYDYPWIWVANPYAPRDKEPESVNVEYIKQMKQLMRDYLEKKRSITEANPDMAAGTVTSKLRTDRERLKEDIVEGAKKANMTCGKWMLFPREDEIPKVWLQVVEAVSAGKLGIGAKVATESKPGEHTRLICIYTKDFSDVVDVRRQLETLADMHLVDRDSSRGIWYKCDAFTYLDIYSDNPYGLKASLYGSREIFSKPETAQGSPKAKPQQKRLTDGSFFKTKESPFKKR